MVQHRLPEHIFIPNVNGNAIYMDYPAHPHLANSDHLTYNPDSQALYFVDSVENPKKWCVDIPGGDVTNGNVLWAWECVDPGAPYQNHQQFEVVELPAV